MKQKKKSGLRAGHSVSTMLTQIWTSITNVLLSTPFSGQGTESVDTGEGKILVHLIQNYSKDPETGEEAWTTGVLPNGDPRCYHWRLPQLAATLQWNIRSRDGY